MWSSPPHIYRETYTYREGYNFYFFQPGQEVGVSQQLHLCVTNAVQMWIVSVASVSIASATSGESTEQRNNRHLNKVSSIERSELHRCEKPPSASAEKMVPGRGGLQGLLNLSGYLLWGEAVDVEDDVGSFDVGGFALLQHFPDL